MKEEYAKLKERPVSTSELARAKRLIRVDFAGRRDGAYAFLSSLNEDLATGDWTRFSTLPTKIAAVTAKDIQAVAKKYLLDDQSTVGWFMATNA
jgi:zinc protease